MPSANRDSTFHPRDDGSGANVAKRLARFVSAQACSRPTGVASPVRSPRPAQLRSVA